MPLFKLATERVVVVPCAANSARHPDKGVNFVSLKCHQGCDFTRESGRQEHSKIAQALDWLHDHRNSLEE